jgi:hypothetical protein
MPRARIILASSRVVTTASTSPAPLGRRASSFFAVHGITDTRYGGMAVGGQGGTVVRACVRAEATTGGENAISRDAVCVISDARCAGMAMGSERNTGGRCEFELERPVLY